MQLSRDASLQSGWLSNAVHPLQITSTCLYSQVWDRPPKVWIPQLLWNPRIPDPVDFRGRKLDRYTGKPVEGEEAAAEH